MPPFINGVPNIGFPSPYYQDTLIASSDYIYGTNYQFCHGYLSKDLENMTQEKMIQAFGRIGRRKSQSNYTIRLRDNSLIDKLFMKEENKPEVINMNQLFGF